MFFERLMERYDVRKIAGARFAVIGSGTAKALKEKGFEADLMPDVYDGANLGRTLAKQCRPGERILIPRAALGTRELIRNWRRCRDLTVEDIPIYETEYETSPLIDEKKEFENGGNQLRRIYQRLHRERICPGPWRAWIFNSKSGVHRSADPGCGGRTWHEDLDVSEGHMDSVAERLEELVRMEK